MRPVKKEHLRRPTDYGKESLLHPPLPLLVANVTEELYNGTDDASLDDSSESSLNFVDSVNSSDEAVLLSRHTILNDVQEAAKINGDILNFAPSTFAVESDYVLIVIRATNRVELFRLCLEKWREVMSIERTRFLISIDGALVDMEDLVDNIEFCSAKRVRFPWSEHHIFNHTVGHADHTDLYEHTRPKSHFVAAKHHFWWLAHEIFSNEKAPEYVVFAEEDHLPTADFYLAAKQLARLHAQQCRDDCMGFVMGAHAKSHKISSQYLTGYRRVPFMSNSNLGLGISRDWWKKTMSARADGTIADAASVFCAWCDYNWDWSMYRIFHLPSMTIRAKNPQIEEAIIKHKRKIVHPPVRSQFLLQPMFNRLYHVGVCGMHSKVGEISSSTCLQRTRAAIAQLVSGPLKAIDVALANLTAQAQQQQYATFFGKQLPEQIIAEGTHKGSLRTPNGGWSHPYDIALCHGIAEGRPYDIVVRYLRNITVPKPLGEL